VDASLEVLSDAMGFGDDGGGVVGWEYFVGDFGEEG
jgi:hypothetical protein